jgi:hypothetical protein
MQYEEVTRRDWERTALYLAGGMLLIMTAAIFLFAINRIIGAIIWLVGTPKCTPISANSVENNLRSHP